MFTSNIGIDFIYLFPELKKENRRCNMFIAGCEVEFLIYESGSLKEKRSVVKSLINKIKSRFAISVIESGDNDLWKKGKIGFSFCSLSQMEMDQKLDKILEIIEREHRIEVIDFSREVFKI
jgi:uncharacterized protein YlxP (DUF503 family)